MKLPTKLIVIAAAVLILASAVGVLIALTGGASMPSYARPGAAETPRTALAFGAVESPRAALEWLDIVLPSPVKDEMRREIGMNPLDPKMYEAQGIDVDAPVGAAWLDMRAEAFMLSVGVTDVDEARAAVKMLMNRTRRVEPNEISETLFGDVPAIVLTGGFDPLTGGFDPIAVLFKGDRAILVTGDRLSKYVDAHNDLEGLNALANRVASLSAGDSLAEVEGVGDSLSLKHSGFAVGFLNVSALRNLVDGRSSEAAIYRDILGEIEGVGAGVALSEDRVAVSTHITMREESRIVEALQDVERASGRLNALPGPAFIAAHAQVNPDKALALAEHYVRMDKYAYRNWERSQSEIQKVLGVSLHGDVLGNLTGEVGGVLTALPPASNPEAVSFVTFAGVKDHDKAQSLLSRATGALADMGGFVQVDRESIDDTTLFHARFGGGLTVDLAAHGGRVWLAMGPGMLRNIITGDSKSFRESDRGAELAGCLGEGSNVSAVVDVNAFFVQLSPLLYPWDRWTLKAAAPVTSKVDYTCVAVGMDGDDLLVDAVQWQK